MRKKYAKLQQISNDRKITKDTDYEFMYHLEHALLLALQESGTLNYMQFKEAEKKLNEQRKNWSRKLAQKGVSNE